jgi:hypothetical protein
LDQWKTHRKDRKDIEASTLCPFLFFAVRYSIKIIFQQPWQHPHPHYFPTHAQRMSTLTRSAAPGMGGRSGAGETAQVSGDGGRRGSEGMDGARESFNINKKSGFVLVICQMMCVTQNIYFYSYCHGTHPHRNCQYHRTPSPRLILVVPHRLF